MAKVTGPLFSMNVTGAFGNIIFDKRGFAYLKPERRDAKTKRQGNYRQAMAVAQKGVKLCGPTTRQLLKETSTTATWHGYLMKNIIGPQHSHYNRYLRQYSELESAQAAWEAAALEAGLRPIEVEYANEAGVSPGAQLFILAAALYDLGLYASLGRPEGNAEVWRESVAR